MNNLEEKILSKLTFLLGFFSLVFLPSLGRLILAHVMVILLVFFLTYIFFRYGYYGEFWFFVKSHFIFFALAFLYFISTILGAIFHKNFIGITTSFVFITIFSLAAILAFFTRKFQKNLFYNFWLGFYFSVLLSSFIIFFDILLFQFTGKVIIEYLPVHLTSSAGDHPLKNLDNPLRELIPEWPFLRAGAFSWDPGINGPAFVMCFILVWEKIASFPLRFLGLGVILLAILVSFSKTSIVGLFVYLLIKAFFQVIRNNFFLKELVLKILPLVAFIFLFFIGYFFNYELKQETFWNISILRHLKYLGSVIYLAKASFLEIIFGFGYRHTGYFLLTYVSWFQIDLAFDPRKDLESFLTNVFLWGGLLGVFYWIYGYIKAYQKSTEGFKLYFIIVLFLTFGYNFHAVWFLVLYHSFLWYNFLKLNQNSTVS